MFVQYALVSGHDIPSSNGFELEESSARANTPLPTPVGGEQPHAHIGLGGDPSKHLLTQWHFDKYTAPYRKAASFEPADSLAGLQRYFDWADFSGYNLV